MRASKQHITIIELLLVFGLIALIASLVGFNIIKMRKEQRFHSGVEQVAHRLRIATEIMLLHSDNVLITFEKKPKGLSVILETDTPLQTGLSKLVNVNSLIQGVESFAFVDQENVTHRGEVTLLFSAVYKETPRGTLILSGYPSITSEGPLNKTLVLKGYPHFIEISSGKRFEQVDEMESETFYPKEIRQELQNAVQDESS